MKANCPTCGLRFDRGDSGYALGAMWFNLLAAEAVTLGLSLSVIVFTWPSPPWNTLQVTGPLEAVAMPLLFFPFSRTLFLALDLSLRPVELDNPEKM